MFAVIYRFSVRPGELNEFTAAWEELTILIRKHEGSLGSRLHRSGENEYIAYAQWPERSVWEGSGKLLPPEADVVRKRLRDSCTSIETIYELEVVKDLLA
jgi:heme-degrading monooxygenase HmoA